MPSPHNFDLDPTFRGFVAGQKVFSSRYALVRMLGRGGMGVVWLARDEHLEVEVALKFLPPEIALDRSAIDDMKRETRRSRELAHRGIVKVYHFELEPERQRAGISMEYVDGDTLANLKVDQPGKCFSHTQLAVWLPELCDALDYAHSEGKMVHRDLKPANVMLDSRARIKITDFGIASSIADSVNSMRSVDRGSSGTPPYMSPQQAAGKTAQRSDDIYSLGATIYDLLTGKPPFFSGNIHHQVENIVPPPMTARRVELGTSGESIPRQWEETIAACLAKDPAQRPQSAGEVAHRLGLNEHFTPSRAQKISVETPIARKPRHAFLGKRKGVLAATLLALLVVGAFGGWWFGTERPRREAERQRQVAAQKEQDQKENEARQRQIAEQERVTRENKLKAEADAEKERLAVAQSAREEEERKRKESLRAAVAGATKERPYVNSLGMKFVPVSGTGVLFSIWETRVKDYRVFAEATRRQWKKPVFQQTDEHPAVNVSWEDADAFCKWLTEQEHNAGRIGANQTYRMPTDLQWSAAVGLAQETGSTPEERDSKVKGVYPWGTTWPPPKGAGNYDSSLKVDDFAQTSPVGSFAANLWGIHDLGGNVWEWCEDWWNAEKIFRVVRGASWDAATTGYLQSSWRYDYQRSEPGLVDEVGLRCVLVVDPSR